MMQGYWLGIMAVCLAAALGIWIALVFRADKSSARPQENSPRREVVGGTFEARRGGRQVMPDPREPIVHEPDEATEAAVPEQRRGEAEETATRRERR